MATLPLNKAVPLAAEGEVAVYDKEGETAWLLRQHCGATGHHGWRGSAPGRATTSSPKKGVRRTMAEHIHRVCAAILRGDSILMVQIDYGERTVWTLPGGESESGETPEQTVVREVAEEACVQARAGRHLYTTVTSNERYVVTERCYLCEIDADQVPAPGHNPGFETQRFIDATWIPLAHVVNDRQVSQVLAALQGAS